MKGDRGDGDDGDEDDERKIRQASAPEYRHLITIRAGKPKGSLKDALKVDSNTVRRLSLSEQELAKAAASHGADLVRYFVLVFSPLLSSLLIHAGIVMF